MLFSGLRGLFVYFENRIQNTEIQTALILRFKAFSGFGRSSIPFQGKTLLYLILSRFMRFYRSGCLRSLYVLRRLGVCRLPCLFCVLSVFFAYSVTCMLFTQKSITSDFMTFDSVLNVC